MRRGSWRFAAVLQIIQDTFHNPWVFDTGDQLDGTAALLAGFDIDLKQDSSSKAEDEAFVP